MIKKLIILIAFACSACQSQIIEEKLAGNNAKYSIKHSRNWDFFNYGFDGDTYEDPYLEPEATLTYGKLLDAKVAIFFIKTSSNNCILKNSTSYTYQEIEGNLTEENRRKSLYKFFNEWQNNSNVEFARVYFSTNNKECVLFELHKKKGPRQKFKSKNFYDIISSFHEITR